MGKVRKLFIDASPITEARVSGIGHMTAELVRSLDKSQHNGIDFEINLVVCKDKKQHLEQWKYNKVKVITLPVRQRVFNLFWKFDLLPPMDMFLGKGIYLFPNYKNWRLMFSKSLTFICDISYIKFPQYIEPKNLEFLTKNIQKWIKRTDKVLAISSSARKEIISELQVPEEKTYLIPCGVDSQIFYPRPKVEIDELMLTLDIKKKYILYIGNIEPRKNITALIAAYANLSAEMRSVYSLLLVGGGGWLNESIVKVIKDSQESGLDIIRPTKYIPDEELPALFSGSSLLVHPAFYEGFGISPLQAMACGVPVIVANNSSLPEVVGDAGLLVDADDTNDLSVKIEKVLNDNKVSKELSTAGLEQAKKFSWDDSARKLAVLIGETN